MMHVQHIILYEKHHKHSDKRQEVQSRKGQVPFEYIKTYLLLYSLFPLEPALSHWGPEKLGKGCERRRGGGGEEGSN